MPRPAKPIELHAINGNARHLSNSEIEERKQAEQKRRSGVKKLTATTETKSNATAYGMFKKLSKLYSGIEYVEALDDNIINRYCTMYAECALFENTLHSLELELDNCDEFKERIEIYKTINATAANINKLRSMLLQIEDRIYLNPTARTKNVPPKPKEKESDKNAELFG